MLWIGLYSATRFNFFWTVTGRKFPPEVLWKTVNEKAVEKYWVRNLGEDLFTKFAGPHMHLFPTDYMSMDLKSWEEITEKI